MGLNIKFVQTGDGSNTLYSSKFKQHFHSLKDGALNESLYKHIIPAFEYHKSKKQLNILDICFGIGYNTLATLYYIKKNNLDIKVNIYSPEFDMQLINSLADFKYPSQLDDFKHIIIQLSKTLKYKDENIQIEIFNGDARKYIKDFKNITKEIKGFDIVYQDAFSSEVNRSLWTQEYFADIYAILSAKAIITTYSIATPIRLSMSENGLFIYEYKKELKDKSTIALTTKNDFQNGCYKFIDMQLKKQRNPLAKPLRDL